MDIMRQGWELGLIQVILLVNHPGVIQLVTKAAVWGISRPTRWEVEHFLAEVVIYCNDFPFIDFL